jgi:hypothetical protein
MMSAVNEFSTDELINRLAADAGPVRPLAPPMFRLLIALIIAFAIMTATVFIHGFSPSLMDQVGDARFVLEFGASILTGISALAAAFLLALPDRSPNYVYLPVPALLVLLLTLGRGCYGDFLHISANGVRFDESSFCFAYIVEVGVLLTIPMVIMLRHAARVRPGPVTLMIGLAGATLANGALKLFHDEDTALLILVWHGSATLFVVFGSYLLREVSFRLSARLAA